MDDLSETSENPRLKIYKIFNKSESEVTADVEIIRKWLETQPHLPEIMRDSYIRNFLILNKFSIEKTKQKIDMYYTIRSLIPEFYEEANPKHPRMQKCLNIFNVGYHPKLFKGLYRIFFYSPVEPNATIVPDTLILAFNTAEMQLNEEPTLKHIHVFDFKNVSFTDMAKYTPSVVRKALTVYQKVFSLPLEAAYMVNAPSFVLNFLEILKSLMKPKLFDRIRVSQNCDILKEILSVDDLPKDYGGNGPSLQELTNILRKKFDEYQGRFDQLDKLRVDESLRPEPLVNDEVLGFYGNFKKLDVD